MFKNNFLLILCLIVCVLEYFGLWLNGVKGVWLKRVIYKGGEGVMEKNFDG